MDTMRRFFTRKSRQSQRESVVDIEIGDGLDSETEKLVKTEEDNSNNFDDISFIVDYIGSDYVPEAQSLPLLLETAKKIKKQHTKGIRVDLTLRRGVLKVTDNEQGALLITAPLYAIALCAQEQLRGFETTFALNITRRRIHLCHVFQAGSRLEASSIVRSVALLFRSVAKELKEKRNETSQENAGNRLRTESDMSAREFDVIARRHGRLGTLPTLQSVENLEELQDQSQLGENQIVSVQINHSEAPSNEIELVSKKEEEREDRRSDSISPNELYDRALTSLNRHNISTLQRCLEEGLNVDTLDGSSLSLLHHAVLQNQPIVVEFLLCRGADVNIEDQKYQTPLHVAAAQGNRAITQILLAFGANVRAKDSQYRTPLHLCVNNLQNLEVSYVLVEHGARIEENDFEGIRPVDLRLELREMQNRLIQSACEAFSAADLSRSRSNSGCSSYTGSIRSNRSPAVSKRGFKMFRSGSVRIKPSPSLQSIQDIDDESDASSSFHLPAHSKFENETRFGISNIIKQAHSISNRFNGSLSQNDNSSDISKSETDCLCSDPVENTGYGSTTTRDETTDSEFDTRKGCDIYSDDYNYASETDDENAKKVNNKSIPKLFKKDPATDALHLLVTLSANAECQASILSNICLPSFSNQLVLLGHGMNLNNRNLQLISTLLLNVFNISGPVGRKKCVSAGLLKTVIDLLDAAEPVQTACLSILNDLVQTDGDRDYSSTISGIPIEPLLNMIQSMEPSVALELTQDKSKMKMSRCHDTGYTSSSPLVERAGSLKNKAFIEDNLLKSNTIGRSKTYTKGDFLSNETFLRARADSLGITSDISSLSIQRGAVSRNSSDTEKDGGARGRRFSRGSNTSVETNKPHGNIVARHIAMKMLAASSLNSKLQEDLAKPRILKLLLERLNDQHEEIVLQASATLANIASNIETHLQLQVENIEEALFHLLEVSNKRIQFHAARGLVYMGHLNIKGVYIFDNLQDEGNQNIITGEEDGKTFIKGATIENIIYVLTDDFNLLWGGARLNPPSPVDKKSTNHHSNAKTRSKTPPNEFQVINFIFSTYQTFVHPIIIMRLLLHRFRKPDDYKVFENLTKNIEVRIEHYAPLPVLHARLMRVWITWLEISPQDFVHHPTILTELASLIPLMRTIDGPYAPCADRLEQLLTSAEETMIKKQTSSYRKENINHHNRLYEQSYKAVNDGKLPCTEDDFVFLAALQLYIEDLCQYGQDFTLRINTVDSVNASRLKQSINAQTASSKTLLKKIRSQYEQFFQEQSTERNAKHIYVDCCQGIDGYGCRFFKVRQLIPSNRTRKKVFISRLFGVNSKRIVILDERSKTCVEKFNSRDLRSWVPMEDSLTLRTIFVTKTNEKTFEFLLENRLAFKELSNYILTCTMELNYHGYHNIDTNPWSVLAEEYGTWGSMALQTYVDKQRLEKIDSPNRPRSTTTMFSSKSSLSPTGSGILPRGYSQSAPTRQEGSWDANEALSFMNLRGKLRSRGETILSTTQIITEEESPPNSLPKDSGMLLEPLGKSGPESKPGPSRLRAPSNLVQSSASIPEGTSLVESASVITDCSPSDYTKSNNGKILTCTCPPDADLPELNLREFSAFELLNHPRELARQITLIDHEMFCEITPDDVLHKISLGLVRKFQKDSGSQHASVDNIAQRFNQMSNWIIHSVVSERNIQRRATVFVNFIETAKQCLELRNYNAVMAIVVAALGSTSVRRLAGTKELIPPEYLSSLQKMENLMDSRSNHKRYRDTLLSSQTPAVPYFGMYLKDLTFISDGNPDYLRGGVVNLSKRRQVYLILERIHRFQKKKYNFQQVPEIRDYLLNKPTVSQEELHSISKENEPTVSSRFASVTPPPFSLYSYERRGSIHGNLFRYNSSSRTIMKRAHQRFGISATQV